MSAVDLSSLCNITVTEVEQLPTDEAIAVLKPVREAVFTTCLAHATTNLSKPIPICIIDRNLVTHLCSKPLQTVLLSNYTLEKQIKKHPEFTISQYTTVIDSLLKTARVVKEGRAQYSHHLVFMKKSGHLDKDGAPLYYKLVIKATKAGDELYFASFHFADKRAVSVIKAQGSTLRLPCYKT